MEHEETPKEEGTATHPMSDEAPSPGSKESGQSKSADVKDNSPISTESILSSINEECNKISCKEKTKASEPLSDNLSNENTSSKESKEVAENGLSSLNSSNDEHNTDSQDPPVNLSITNDDTANCDSTDASSIASKGKASDTETNEEKEVSDSEASKEVTFVEPIEDQGFSDIEIVEAMSPTFNLENEKNDKSDSPLSQNKEHSLPEIVTDQEISEVEMDSNQSSAKEDSNSSSTKELTSQSVKDSENKESADGENNGAGKIKIKLRSLASLCEGDTPKEDTVPGNSNSFIHPTTNFEVTGVAVGDIVQHSNFVESDESGVMHLKISNVVGGEDCITGLSMDEATDSLLPIQISSITSLIEPLSPDDSKSEKSMSNNIQGSCNDIETAQGGSLSEKTYGESNKEMLLSNNDSSITGRGEIIVNIFRSPLIVTHNCVFCKKKWVCEFRMVVRENSDNRVSFICTSKCKANVVSKLPENHLVQKPRLYFERICGMCGQDISTIPRPNTLSWQTREFCNKLCLADHIGEVARTCFYCKCNVRVLYMVKYCVRFGSDVHQFCCNSCLETFKTTIKVCSFCQKNLNLVNKVISPSNKEYCSNKCLKRAQRRDVGQINYKEENDCTVCLKTMVNKYEFLHNGATTFLCSNPCLNVFKYVNQVISVNCCLCARLLNAEDTCNYFFNGKQLRVFCSESCFSVFVISARKIVTCHYCKVKKYSFDMIATLSDELEEYFCCSVCCLNFIESQNKKAVTAIPAASAITDSDSPITTTGQTPAVVDPTLTTTTASTNNSTPSTPLLKNCNMCSKLEPAQFHMVMSDSTLRSFCSYVCATRYKCTFGFQVSGTIQAHEQKDAERIASQNSTPPPAKSVNSDTQTTIQPVNAAGSKAPTKLDFKDSKTIMRLFCPPHMTNKSTMCRPLTNTKGVQCKPHQWHKSCQTDDEVRAIIPVPIPVYVPTPMMMYNAPTPVPLLVPVPVPVPIFIPTAEKTTKELEEKIKSLIKSQCGEEKALKGKKDGAELEEEERTSLKRKTMEEEEEEEQTEVEAEPQVAGNGSDFNETEIDVIAKIEMSLPKFILEEAAGASVAERNESENHKRKSDSAESSVSKRRKVDEGEEEEETECLDLLMGLSVWHSWVQRKVAEGSEESQLLQEDLSNMTNETLNQSLILFLEEVSGETLQCEADTLFYILLGLQKYLFEKGSTHCIFLEVNFSEFTTVFDGIVQRFFEVAAQPETKCLVGTRVTEEMLWEARQLGAHTPHVLINTLFYFNTKIFRLKTAVEHFNLTFNHVMKQGKRVSNAPDGSPALTMYLKYSHDEKSEEKESGSEPPLMFENKDNPLRCPVKLYEFYLSKCPYNIRTEKNTYYVYPERTCLPDSPVWYSSEPLEVETLEKMFNRILLVREVQEALFGM